MGPRKLGKSGGKIDINKPLATGWADWQLKIDKVLPHAEEWTDFIPATSTTTTASPNELPDGVRVRLEQMGEAMGEMLAASLERLFLSAGDNDLILKVSDPGKKIFSFDLVAADGKPIQSYGTMDIEPYRIVRMLEPIPPTATLQVRLKTPKSFGEVPFALANVKLP